MFKLRAAIYLVPWLLLAGCLGGDTGTEGSRKACDRRLSETPVGPDTETPRGTAGALARRATLEHDVQLAYWSIQGGSSVRSESAGSIRVMPDASSARLVEHNDRVEKERACPPSLEMAALIELRSEDGAFVESFLGTLEEGDEGGPVTAHGQRPYVQRGGNYQTDALSDAKDRVFKIRLWLSDSGYGLSESMAHWTGNLTMDAPSVKGGVSAAIADF
jgi:hypothetical protein